MDGGEAAQFVSATQSGLKPGQTVRLAGPAAGCAVAASQPNGSAVLAVPTDDGLVVSLRAADGEWSEPTKFPNGGHLSTGQAAVAVSETGDALVVWQNAAPGRRVQLRAARRIAGGTFSAPVMLAERTLQPARASDQSDWFAAGIANGGEAIVAWTGLPPERPPHRTPVTVAIAPAGGQFGAAVNVGQQSGYSTSSLSMAPDGRALITLAGPKRVQLVERSAGTPFGAPVTVANVGDPLGTRTVTALGDRGQAVVAWSGTGLGGVRATIRRGGGPFSGALPTASADKRIAYDVWTATTGATQDVPAGSWGFGGANVRATIANGIALLGWSGPRGGTRAANLATYPLAGGTGERQTTGGALADVWEAFPLLLPDGTAALAWIDQPAASRVHRLRLAAGAPADTTPLPVVRVSPPKQHVVASNGDLVLPVRCSSPCEVRARLLNRHGYEASVRMTAAGSGRLRLTDVDAPKRLGPVKVRLTAGAIDGRRSRSWTTIYRLVGGERRYRLMEVEPVRAVRHGNKVRVTVRVELALDSEGYFSVGGFDRRGNIEPLATEPTIVQPGRRESSVALPAEGVRWVAVLWGGKRKFVRVH